MEGLGGPSGDGSSDGGAEPTANVALDITLAAVLVGSVCHLRCVARFPPGSSFSFFPVVFVYAGAIAAAAFAMIRPHLTPQPHWAPQLLQINAKRKRKSADS